jgi:uncharacterized circularly permuted ATP-grasp superfamily protein/uncharacterized alpha-E superfamily protein
LSGPAARDEMVDGKGGLRPYWLGVLGSFRALGDAGVAERAHRLNHAFEEEGITSVLPGASAAEHAWRCDPVPLLLGADEFATLEEGLAQRARLMEAVLADLAGDCRLLADGVLPPALLYPNPAYLRVARGASPAPLLHFYAADLLRGPDGAWRVLADRTAGPTGVGYARENRRLLNRVIPELFRSVQVRQLRPFFDVWQDALQRLAPRPADGDADDGLSAVALLTEGTRDPQWFEHLYLSRELNCALVEGGDLTVRGGTVFLKTLKGLRRISVLLRRVDGRMVDPLELEPSRGIGVPGLLDAVRCGNLRIANDPIAGVLEAPALAAFLPGLCMRLLGEKLLTASVPTMWLGEERARSLVMADPARWLIRPAVDGHAAAIQVDRLDAAARTELLDRIARRPWAWSASAAIPPSMAPCLDADGRLAPKPVVLRMFLVWDGTAWRAMPGGLARVLEDSERLAGRLPRAAMSKDVWVLSEDGSDIVGPAAQPAGKLAIRRGSGDLPSRVADDLFWLGRYVERLERAARLIRATLVRLARGSTLLPRETSELQALARCLVDAGIIEPEASAGGASTDLLARAMLATVRERGSIDDLFGSVTRLTESVRDRLTGDMYSTFLANLRAARAATREAGLSLDGLSRGMVATLRFSNAIAGVAAENMVRGGAFLFLDLGRRLERACAVAAEVASAIDQPPARVEIGLRLALELCDSAITYRNRYLNVIQPAPVLDLVLCDQGNPRGLAFQIEAMHRHLGDLADDIVAGEPLVETVAGFLAQAEMMVAEVLASPDQAATAADLPEQLRAIGAGVAELSVQITRRYFALLPEIATLGWRSEETTPLRGAA